MTEPSYAVSQYALFGREPAEVFQLQSPADAQEIVQQSAGKSIVPWGGGCRQSLGYPPERYDVALLTQGLNQITEYEPADLTITAQAGVTLAHLQSVLAAQGQCLPLDIALPERQTLGGMIATRSNSLRRFSGGSVRDLLLGVSVINSRGEMVKGGGKVVKNVAGYDLPKLYCGSLGTLGLITEATFKVSPLPEMSVTVALPLDADHNSEEVLDQLFDSDLAPSFLFLLSPKAASVILPGPQEAQYVVLGFDGNSESVAWQVDTLGAGKLDNSASIEIRAALRDFALRDSPMTAEFHILSSQVGAFSRMLEWTANRSGFMAQVATDAALGLMTAHFAPHRETADWQVFYADLKDKADRCGGSFIITQMPQALRAADVPVWSPLLPDFGLMARLKETLDPARMWNPGRFIGKL
ncbi:MAG: FAD-binding oxidoreductase [Janthinobacterium lividum]